MKTSYQRSTLYATHSLELGIDNGIIVARTDSLGAGLTQKVPVSLQPGDLGSKYNDFLDTEAVNDVADLKDGDITIRVNGELAKPKRLDNGLYAFKDDTGFDRVVLDCITSLEHGADLLWIETEKPNVEQIAAMVNAVREGDQKQNWFTTTLHRLTRTLKFREQVYEEMKAAGKDVSVYPDPAEDPMGLMDVAIDSTEVGRRRGSIGKHLPGRCSAGSWHIPPFDHATNLPHRRIVD